MNRRNFLKAFGVFAIVVATTPAKVVNDWDEIREKETYSRVVGFKGRQFYEAGFIYAPYIPLLVTDKICVSPSKRDYTKYVSKFKVYRDPEIQKQIEKSVDEAIMTAIKKCKRDERRAYWSRKLKVLLGLS